MPELLHISDIHFGPAFLPDRAAAIQHVIAHRRPDLVVVSGDLTRRAKRHQFEAAAEFLASFEEPVAVTPGNHDVPLYRVWERILSPYGLYREYVRQDLDSVYRIDGLTLVSLNSTGPLRITNGRLRGAQFEFAERAFDASPESDFRAIVTHHHLASPPDFAHGHVIPGGRRRGLGVCAVLVRAAGFVRLFLVGPATTRSAVAWPHGGFGRRRVRPRAA